MFIALGGSMGKSKYEDNYEKLTKKVPVLPYFTTTVAGFFSQFTLAYSLP